MIAPSSAAARRRASASAALAALALAALWGAGRLHAPLLEIRRERQLDQADPLENTPPLVAFTTVAIGGFRGLAVDALWVRLQTLQEQGRYFELVQLADWITKLQPRFDAVWGYQAWNLAYNVSAMFDRPEDRWRWVRHGLTLLRDRGLAYNPGSAHLHFELSWIFFHKIGQDLDDAHDFYKLEWAREMEDALGGPTPDWSALAAAPPSREAFRRDPALAAFVDRLEREGVDPWSRRWLRAGESEALPDWARGGPEAEAWRNGLRAECLRADYRLDLPVLLEAERRFGPFDWRLPPAHAVYWALRGTPLAREDVRRRALTRRALQASAEGLFQGRVAGFAPREGRLLLARNLEAMPNVLRAYEDAVRSEKGDELFAEGCRRLLVDAVMFSYTSGDPAAAAAYFERLRAQDPEGLAGAEMEGFVAGVYAGYVARGGPFDPAATVDRALYESEFWGAMGDERQAAGYAQLAELCHRRPVGPEPDAAPPPLPPIETLRAAAAARARADAAKYRPGAAVREVLPTPPPPA